MNDDLKLKFELYVRRLGNSGWDDLLERGMESAKAIGEALDQPGPLSVARASMAVARTFTASDIYYADVLDPGSWKSMFPSCLKTQLLELLEPHVTSKIRVNKSGNCNAHFVSPEGVRIGWVRDGDEDQHTTDLLAHADTYGASVAYARELLWRSVNSNRLVLAASSRPGGRQRKGSYKGDGQLRVTTDELVACADSEFSTTYAPYLRKCLEQGVNRTVLFYGPPGSGKTTVTRTLCDLLELRSLRVRVEDIADLGSEVLADMIKIIEPDVVIFDDLDRALSQVALLETLENLHKTVRFVFATVNDIYCLEPALLRPGRFDELIEVTKLDPSAVKMLLGEFATDSYEVVKDWPVAFINEYCIRRRLLGKEKALAALEDLQKRVERLSYDTEQAEG